MAQWVNRLWNNIFVNPLPLPLSFEISGALHLVQPGLTAGRQAGRRNTLKIFKIGYRLKYLSFRNQDTVSLYVHSLTNAFQWVFSDKAYCKVDF